MSVESSVPRKPRADAERNRLRLLDAAKAAFAQKGAQVSLEEIARAAGVGIGTLYRHFPTRDALIEQVYRNESRQLAEAARTLAAAHPPVEALRRWMLLFVDYLATKTVMVAALNALMADTSGLYAESGALLRSSIGMLIDRAVASGDIRIDIEPIELLRAIAGVSGGGAGPEWKDVARRLVDILLAGLRTEG